jgi:hypothetical protein
MTKPYFPVTKPYLRVAKLDFAKGKRYLGASKLIAV